MIEDQQYWNENSNGFSRGKSRIYLICSMGLGISSFVSMVFICLTIFVGVSLRFSVEELLSSKLSTRFFDRFVGANVRGLSSESDDGDGLRSLFSTLITGRSSSFFGPVGSFFAKNELNEFLTFDSIINRKLNLRNRWLIGLFHCTHFHFFRRRR